MQIPSWDVHAGSIHSDKIMINDLPLRKRIMTLRIKTSWSDVNIAFFKDNFCTFHVQNSPDPPPKMF